MAIYFHFQKPTILSNRKLLRSFIFKIFEYENRTLAQLEYVFCDNDFLLNINQTFLKHDYFTDVITFNLADLDSLPIRGEIYISVEMVKQNSLHFRVSFAQELYRVIFHGILHLCGYDDKKPQDKLVMKNKENFYLAAFLDSINAITF